MLQVHIVIQDQSVPRAMYTSRTPPHGQCPVTETSNPPPINQPCTPRWYHCNMRQTGTVAVTRCSHNWIVQYRNRTQWAWPYACSKGKRILISQPQQGMLMMPSLDTAGLTSDVLPAMCYIVLISRYPSFDWNSLVHSGNHIRCIRDQETAARHLNGACYCSETQATTRHTCH